MNEPPNFVRKYCLIAELLIFKYRWQNISVSNTALHTVLQSLVRKWHCGWRNQCETVQLLTLIPDSIVPALWPAKSPDLNPIDYKIWGKLQERVYRSRIVTLTRWSRTWSRVGTFPTPVLFINEAVRQWRPRLLLAFKHMEDILNTDFKCVWYLHKRTLWQSVVTCLSGYL